MADTGIDTVDDDGRFGGARSGNASGDFADYEDVEEFRDIVPTTTVNKQCVSLELSYS